MANLRNNILLTTDVPDIESLTKNINATLDEIKHIFEDAFAEGKSKPEPNSHAFHQIAIFLEVWNHLSRVGKFKDLTKLNEHYTQVEKNLDHTINMYCYKNGVDKKNFVAIRPVLSGVVELYHGLTKQLFSLNAFVIKDAKTYEREVQEALALFEKTKKELNSLDISVIEKQLNGFELGLRELVEKLNALNYDKIHIGFNNAIKDEHRSDGVLYEIRKQLNRFPTVDNLNETINKLHEKQKESLRKAYYNKLTGYIQLLQDIKSELNDIVSAHLDLCINTLKQLTQIENTVSHNIATLEEASETLGGDFRHALSIRGYKTINGEVIRGYEDIIDATKKTMLACKQQVRFSLGFKANPWSIAEEKLQTVVQKQIHTLDHFAASYLENRESLKKVENGIKENRFKSREIDTLIAYTDSLIIKAKKIPEQCCGVITKVQNELAAHLDVYSNFLKVFFTHHWLKMLVGGIGGSGIATVAGILTVGLSPAALIALISAGAIFGFGVGGGAGLATDQMKEKEVKEGEGQTEQTEGRQVRDGTAQNQSWSAKFLSMFYRHPMPPEQSAQGADNVRRFIN